MPCRKTFSENTAGKKMNSSGNSAGERIRIRVSSFRSNATSLISRIKRNADQRQNSIPHLSVVMHSSSPYRCENSSTRVVCLEKITVCSLNTLHPLDLPALACIIYLHPGYRRHFTMRMGVLFSIIRKPSEAVHCERMAERSEWMLSNSSPPFRIFSALS